ncbi:MAG: UDP-N-acetylglucosamine--N-acetylmuramyl-(pentapeptide) pyrophosphoryl-undecaprenol N-acetylglucosamine transferase, partial [Pelagibacterales bacterium]|nr:UDP-N-acetylglucosamine--N-acetylmuramyl-(pentapeptide) pyrophosphoryl-undecaprenol N-acetylglucosamine transferase [Pelagibacterales bacterium]
MKKKILISSGGSGGHVIPATIFYEHLKNKFDVFFTVDKRGAKFLNLEKYKATIIDTPKLTNNLFLLPLNFFAFFFSIIKSLIFFKKNKIDILISTGGYMSLPFCITAKIFNITIYLFEPNMVLGRANNFFVKYCKKIFCYSNEIVNFPIKYMNRILLIDPLLRKEFYSIIPNNKKTINEEITFLIIGGSQGAKLFDNELKNTIIEISKKYKLNVYQQTDFSNIQNLKNFYNENKIYFRLFSFEENIINLISKANLCITRAGASTLSELTYLNVPYLAIPYPLAKDNHQYQNALFYKNKDCCWILQQDQLKNKVLANFLINI